jgi:hypothetical protein
MQIVLLRAAKFHECKVLLDVRCESGATSLKLVSVTNREGEQMGIQLSSVGKIFCGVLAAAALFGGGYVAGQNRFGQPKTILHVVELKWSPAASDAQKQQAIDGIKDMAAKIPGIKNIWIKGERMQPRDFSAAYAIEFRDRAAADAYAESPVHAAWEAQYVLLRAASVSIQVTNP